MGLFKKKQDPLSERARALQRQIADLEAQIAQLSTGEAVPLAEPAPEGKPFKPQPSASTPPNPPARTSSEKPAPANRPPKPAPEPHLEAPEEPTGPAPAQPRLRSTTLPRGQSVPACVPGPVEQPVAPVPVAAPGGVSEPIFEDFSRNPFKAPAATPPERREQDQELGMRGSSWWQWFKNQFRAPATTNPKLVSYLAAGSLQGLRPLRYEKRVARNRAIALIVFLILVIWWVVVIFIKL